MPLIEIDVPQRAKLPALAPSTLEFIDLANDAIEQFLLRHPADIDNFVTCDFHLVAQALQWIVDQGLAGGSRFCEFGSGFGVVTMLADMVGMSAVGIEIESALVDESIDLATQVNSDAKFYCGSFLPADVGDQIIDSNEYSHLTLEIDDVYQEIGFAPDDFDLFFAFPWPGEESLFAKIVQHSAADQALLLTYRGRDGMHLLRSRR